jgi:hypothetical protein
MTDDDRPVTNPGTKDDEMAKEAKDHMATKTLEEWLPRMPDEMVDAETAEAAFTDEDAGR